jgi:hypothetical protein
MVEGLKLRDIVELPPRYFMLATSALLIIENYKIRRCDCGTDTHAPQIFLQKGKLATM